MIVEPEQILTFLINHHHLVNCTASPLLQVGFGAKARLPGHCVLLVRYYPSLLTSIR